jgi:hypothetical protein
MMRIRLPLVVPFVSILITASSQAVPPVPATPAAIRSIIPPPGLYYEESTYGSSASGANGTVEVHGRNKGGRSEQTITKRWAGEKGFTAHGADNAPQTICIGPLMDARPILKQSGCELISSVVANGEITTASQCAGSQVVATIRKTGSSMWEIRSRIANSTVGSVTAAVAGGDFRAVLAYQAKHAPTAEERAEAAKALGGYDSNAQQGHTVTEEAEQTLRSMGKKPPTPNHRPQSGLGALEVDIVQTLTRIGTTCKP